MTTRPAAKDLTQVQSDTEERLRRLEMLQSGQGSVAWRYLPDSYGVTLGRDSFALFYCVRYGYAVFAGPVRVAVSRASGDPLVDGDGNGYVGYMDKAFPSADREFIGYYDTQDWYDEATATYTHLERAPLRMIARTDSTIWIAAPDLRPRSTNIIVPNPAGVAPPQSQAYPTVSTFPL